MTQNKKHIVIDPDLHKKLKLKSVNEDIEMYDLANKILKKEFDEE